MSSNEFCLKTVHDTLVENFVDLNNLVAKCDKLKQKVHKSRTSEDVCNIIEQFMKDLKQKYCGDQENTSTSKLSTSIECFVLNHLYDTVVPIFYEKFKDEDDMIFKKCLSLQNVRLSQTFGDIQLPASIVELASLDSHRTVQDKYACLTACYDFIFAELKFAMVQLITENGEDASEIPRIPVVNNADVVQVLLEVIVCAKCKHLYSNLFFVQSLSDMHLIDNNYRDVLDCFNKAIEVLFEIDEKSVGTLGRKTNSEMNLKQYNKIVQRLDDNAICNGFERLSMRRVTGQISKSLEYINNL